MEHALRQADLSQGKAAQGEQQHPGRPGQVEVAQPVQQQKPPDLFVQVHNRIVPF